MTDVIHVDPTHPDRAKIAHAADCLRRGGLVAFPTETVYGLGAHALDRLAVRRLFEAKGRPSNDPLIVHIASTAELRLLAIDVPASTDALARRFWPGPLTLVVRRSAAVPDEVTAGLDTVALRVPSHPVALALMREAAIPIAAPSANRFSRPSPTRAAHVLDDLQGRIDLVIDGGSTTIGVESTVLDLSRAVPTILRPGAVTVEMLRTVLPAVAAHAPAGTDDGPKASPGLLSKHYAPRAPMTLYEGARQVMLDKLLRDARAALERGQRVGLLLASEDVASVPARWHESLIDLGSEQDVDTVATRLYAGLRELDAAGVDVILARSFPSDTGLGLVIQDRLRRASAGSIVYC